MNEEQIELHFLQLEALLEAANAQTAAQERVATAIETLVKLIQDEARF